MTYDNDPELEDATFVEINRLTERCKAYKGQVEAGAVEIEQLKTALAFYAEPKNYEQSYIASKGYSVSEILFDNGKLARAAIELKETAK